MNQGEQTDVWPHFARLAECCKITVDHPDSSWRVIIQQKDGLHSVCASGPDLLAVVHQAIDEAEGFGWRTDS